MDNQNSVLFSLLLKKYREGTATEEEKRFLETYYDLFDNNEDLITDENEAAYASLKTTLRENIAEAIAHRQQPPKMALHWVRRTVAAAAVIALLGTATWYIVRQMPARRHQVADARHTVKEVSKPTLQLANGAIIELGDSTSGQIAEQQGIVIRKAKDGSLVYEAAKETQQGASDATSARENILTTPKGMKYKVVLPDGSEVWLNAASSLHYPARFAADTRTVQLSGEAYFTVATDAKRPFIVTSGNQSVQVLGTSFNINAYEEEPGVKTTLLQGAVKVTAGNQSCTLVPGQQAVSNDAEALVKRNADTEKETAWINNKFSFRNDDVQVVMRQIARWYDVEIRYNGNIPTDKFVGEIAMSSNLQDVLRILEINGLRFEVSGKVITVSEKK
ncbi:FecR family protein [Chitinophaga sp. Cy-1792]|uniref:FecR family protein n=1 Tax=Chitinophaga sp. Cy-1792 TaxID=2608339 RepID=UPI00141EAFE0|nr:FecR family protein [Chitinophaga sp. Cy-1792]NIG57578.1 DUF4974 domain-containing protein [Chitinophaga sp. Cy-1792]